MDNELYEPVETLCGGEFILCTVKDSDEYVAITDRFEKSQQYYGSLGYALPYEGIKECKSAGVSRLIIVEQPSERELEFKINDYIVGQRLPPHPSQQRVEVFVPREDSVQRASG